VTTEYYLGPAGSQILLPYPNRAPYTRRLLGSITEMQDGSLRLHYRAGQVTFRLEWEDLTEAQKTAIQTEWERHQQVSFVIGAVSYPVLFTLDGYSADPVAGTSPQLYNVSITLVQAS